MNHRAPERPECWRPVAGYSDRYEVSTFGRVRSARTRRALSPYWHGLQLLVKLTSADGRRTSQTVDSLIARAFPDKIAAGEITETRTAIKVGEIVARVHRDAESSFAILQAVADALAADLQGSEWRRSHLTARETMEVRQLSERGAAVGRIAETFRVHHFVVDEALSYRMKETS